jgi:UDPglucose 6-dehydrogenase
MRLCIVGTGYVGLVSAACFAEMGNDVCCVDANPRVVETLNLGRVHIFEPGLEEIVRRNRAEGRLSFTADLAEGLDRALVVFVSVGTPQREDGSCDLSFVEAVARDIGRLMQDSKVVVVKSTVPVGTSDRVRALIAEELARRNAAIGFEVVSNPEFLKEGDAVNDFLKPDRVILGTQSKAAAELLRVLYAPYARSREKVIVMRVRSAEMTKYAANCMLAAKISFINEMANICERVGADVAEVRLGIGSDHRIGYSFIYPGVGYGGSCFPKDVKALIGTARAHGYEPKLVAAVDQVNDAQKRLLADKVEAYFAEQGGVAGKTLALWGLAFKANTDDVREAPALTVIRRLSDKGMRIRAFDPVAGPRAAAELGASPLVAIVDRQYQALEGAQALAVVTDWNQFRNPDFERIKGLLSAPVLFDGRNLYDPALMARLGFAYFGVGRAAVGG